MSKVSEWTQIQPKVVVAIATYRRPESLAALIESLRAQDPGLLHKMVIVDNDVHESAREVATRLAPDAAYIVEPRRGISAARNAGVSAALRYEPWAIAFVDDDETATPDWIRELVRSMQRHHADVVTGPVEYRLTNRPADYKYFQKLERPEGSLVKYVATNNALVLASWFRDDASLRFDEDFGLTGGEDLEFFLRLQLRGGLCVWANSAVVSTQVPRERTQRAWLLRRELRNGQMIARLRHRFDGHSRFKLLAVGAGKVWRSLGPAAREAVRGPVSMTVKFEIVAGVGWITAALGWYYLEYKRLAPSAVPRLPSTERFSEFGRIDGD
ncbi:glycosyltransferase family 2 protein [Arthrobacter sp. MA-N2]|uniref:glycosyltransferase family 2 protein n=1 Tax=Arthrobacter sp. MA-N2 TaxID=1101188 RepID=UPI000485AD52|nr:glycosyltransferase family 2 protein [Arthrobacter sp. MA-N2]